MHLFLCDELPASVETAQAPSAKQETTLSPRAVPAGHRSGEVRNAPHRSRGASGLMEIQWLPGIKSDSDRLDKGIQNLGFGAFSVHFCAYKSEPGVRGRTPGDQHRGPGAKLPMIPPPAGSRQKKGGPPSGPPCNTGGQASSLLMWAPRRAFMMATPRMGAPTMATTPLKTVAGSLDSTSSQHWSAPGRPWISMPL